jgi:hypothetical protein
MVLISRLFVGKAHVFGALKMATRMVAGNTRDGSIRPLGAKEDQVGVM